ncbi:MAG TPA: GspMb/PilO family protein [Pseudomonadales bacterium]|nr:GspMb/PilO family protein [Pseudomonadales bacterium]HNB46047.1 GspMb/PilO family protein [Burkholderiaceae bacterium]HMW14835.1 GspMb/PilO family protein [Pseudomonadales bacterium]HMW84333.1 GspMb/PilO family protein [Pseudomonadales bacterium]HMY96698.1 GspMb/PilO family protein [Pseudomonadales bacterium]
MITAELFTAHLRHQLHRHGWPAAAGLLLGLMALLWQLVIVQAVRSETLAQQAALEALRHQRAAQSTPRQVEGRRLSDLHASLPTDSDALAVIERLHHAATLHGVELPQGDYRLSRDASGTLLRYQITLPARGGYPQLRAWLADLMNALPTIALDGLAVQRDDVGSGRIDARVRLTLFLKAG